MGGDGGEEERDSAIEGYVKMAKVRRITLNTLRKFSVDVHDDITYSWAAFTVNYFSIFEKF